MSAHSTAKPLQEAPNLSGTKAPLARWGSHAHPTLWRSHTRSAPMPRAIRTATGTEERDRRLGNYACVAVMVFLVGTKVRFLDRYKPPQVRWGAVGVIVDVEERPAPNSGTDYWVRARFGDFITRWIEA
jgi:hypothetical protein